MHYFKLIGNPEGYRELWENREALDKYLKRLKELMDEDSEQNSVQETKTTLETNPVTLPRL